MNITELLITGYDGVRTLFAATLTTDGAKVIRSGTNGEGDAVVDEAWAKSTDAFIAVRDLMNDVASNSERGDELARPRRAAGLAPADRSR